jgi:hypothetical protein
VVLVHRQEGLPEGIVLAEKDGVTGRVPLEILDIEN